jgi:NAD+ kinase
MKYENITIIANNTDKAQTILANIQAVYNFNTSKPNQNTDLIIALGGDGFMLHCLHTYMHLDIPIYGINCGTVGFLLNHLNIEKLPELINNALPTITYPLEMTAHLNNGEIKKHLAINEVSVFRKTSQAIKINVSIDGLMRLPELVCDGILLSTPAGSSAYNSSVNGPILPIGSNILALTPISPFLPKKWTGAILPHTAEVELTIIDSKARPASSVADFIEVESVHSILIKEKRDKPIKLLFDPNHSLEERILKEQFSY